MLRCRLIEPHLGGLNPRTISHFVPSDYQDFDLFSNSNKKFKYGQERRKSTTFSPTSSASDAALKLVLGTSYPCVIPLEIPLGMKYEKDYN